MDQFTDRIVAVGLLTRRDLDMLGPTFDRAWPVDEAPEFMALLEAIDEADQQLCGGSPGTRTDQMKG